MAGSASLGNGGALACLLHVPCMLCVPCHLHLQDGSDQQLGPQSNRTVSSPVPAFGESTAYEGTLTTLAAGSTHVCGLEPDGTLYCWGGTPANGREQATSIPEEVGGGRKFVAVSAGTALTCALDAAGDIWCLGEHAAVLFAAAAAWQPSMDASRCMPAACADRECRWDDPQGNACTVLPGADMAGIFLACTLLFARLVFPWPARLRMRRAEHVWGTRQRRPAVLIQA